MRLRGPPRVQQPALVVLSQVSIKLSCGLSPELGPAHPRPALLQARARQFKVDFIRCGSELFTTCIINADQNEMAARKALVRAACHRFLVGMVTWLKFVAG